MKKPVNPSTQVDELPTLCQVILDSLLYCKARLSLKSAKVEETLDLLVLCKKALLQLLNHDQTMKLIQDLAQLQKGGENRPAMFSERRMIKMSQ